MQRIACHIPFPRLGLSSAEIEAKLNKYELYFWRGIFQRWCFQIDGATITITLNGWKYKSADCCRFSKSIMSLQRRFDPKHTRSYKTGLLVKIQVWNSIQLSVLLWLSNILFFITLNFSWMSAMYVLDIFVSFLSFLRPKWYQSFCERLKCGMYVQVVILIKDE